MRSNSSAAALHVRRSSPSPGALRHTRQHGHRTPPPPQARRKHDALAASYGPAAAAIPCDELARLASLLTHIHALRGWAGGGRYLFDQAWGRALARAATGGGGGWEPGFETASMSDAKLAALAVVIDEELLGGALGGGLLARPWRGGVQQPRRRRRQGGAQRQQAGAFTGSGGGSSEQAAAQQQQVQAAAAPNPPLGFRTVDAPRSGWIAYFDESGAVMVNRPRWDKDVSRAAPLNCEGVVCTSRLAVLAHTLAHEIVHAIVFYAFPDIDAGSAAYTANDRHGPVFALLNRQLFGHTSNALARCDARAALGGGH